MVDINYYKVKIYGYWNCLSGNKVLLLFIFIISTLLVLPILALGEIEVLEVDEYEFIGFVQNIHPGHAPYVIFSLTSSTYPGILYYDFRTGDGYESLDFIVDTANRQIKGMDNFTYSTSIYNKDGEDFIAWLGDPYFVIEAGSDWYLAQMLVNEDEDDTHLLELGESLLLEEGIAITPLEIDTNDNKVCFSVTKDGEELDNSTIKEGEIFTYKKDLNESGYNDNWILRFNVDVVFEGMNTNLVKINNTQLISNDIIKIETPDNDMFSGFEITSINSDTTLQIRFDNADDNISLIKNQTVGFIGDTFNFKINEDGDIGGLVVMITEPGIHEIFAEVCNLSPGVYSYFYLTSVNNPGILYYDLDEGVGSEVLDITVSNDDLEIAKGNFTYNTTAYKDENNNNMIAWLGKPYSVVSKCGDWYFSELLIDDGDDDFHLLEIGEALTLKEGYTVIPQEIDVDGEEAWFDIVKNGDVIDSSVQCEGSQYIYEEDLNESGSTDNWVIKFNVETVIAGTNTNTVKINHTSQISSDVVKAEDGDKDLFDGFIIKTYDIAPGKIEIVIDGSDDEIKLKKGGTVSLLGDRFNFKVNENGDIGGILKIVSINESWRDRWMGNGSEGGSKVTTTELQDAIHHWLEDIRISEHLLSTADLREVIAIWLFE
ncbi:MAG: hypothetical protein K8R25_07975 [Methanosarcinales archaeon]|nr:hypothetical protein [Methanosarcinales archaeon]